MQAHRAVCRAVTGKGAAFVWDVFLPVNSNMTQYPCVHLDLTNAAQMEVNYVPPPKKSNF